MWYTPDPTSAPYVCRKVQLIDVIAALSGILIACLEWVAAVAFEV